MLAELIIGYTCSQLFLFQLVATLGTYTLLQLVHLLMIRHKRYQLFKRYDIPGPEPNLFQGNMGYFLTRPYTYELDKKLRDSYGKNFGIFIGDEPTIVVTDVDILKKVFYEDMKIFDERSGYFLSNTLAENSILFARHNRWKLFRKVMSPAFNKYNVRGVNATLFIEDTIKLALDYIDKRLEQNESGKIVANINVHDLMKAAALHMISAMAIKLPNVQVTEDDKYVESLDKFLSLSDKGPVLWACRFPFVKTILSYLARNFDDATLALVKQKLDIAIDEYAKQHSDSADVKKNEQQVIDTLIRLHHEGRLSRDDVIGNAQALLFAGYDTTSTTLAYAFWTLAKHTEVQDRLRSELIAHGVESIYLEQVINETLRLYPTVIAFTTRVANENVKYKELMIPSGTRIMYNSWLLHRDPELWPDPLKFDPERFGPGKSHHPCAFAPFGMGERRCLGYQLAMLEMKMVLCDIVIRYKINLKAPMELRQTVFANVLTKPVEKVMVELEKM